jgi:hypothetical protein
MCLALFIAADGVLPLVPPTTPPSFSVEELAERSLGIRGHFSADWCVRYAGSTSGCGCDFSGCNNGRSRSALRDYLASVLPKAEVQVYACWEGDESVAIENRVTATIDDFVAEEPIIGEGSLITLVHR